MCDGTAREATSGSGLLHIGRRARLRSTANCGTCYFNIWDMRGSLIKVTHNTCSLHLASHFQNQTSHMGMFYMVY